jgi:hypothetical protein
MLGTLEGRVPKGVAVQVCIRAPLVKLFEPRFFSFSGLLDLFKKASLMEAFLVLRTKFLLSIL